MLKCLTIHQPFTSAIAVGSKRTENRSARVHLRGPVALHAGLSVDWSAPDHAWLAAGMDPAERGMPGAEFTLPLGSVIAVADLTGCHWGNGRCCGEWGISGQWHWELSNVRPLTEPVACRGGRGWWTLPAEVESAVRAQLGEK